MSSSVCPSCGKIEKSGDGEYPIYVGLCAECTTTKARYGIGKKGRAASGLRGRP